MRTRSRWIVAGGAAALVITPVAAVYGSPTLETELDQAGLVVDAEGANRARAARATPTPAATAPTPAATAPATSADRSGSTVRPPARADAAPSIEAADEEPSGKKTVSAASPVSPTSPRSPKSPDTPR